MFYFDPLYMVVMIAGLVIGGGASLLVKMAFNKYSRVRASSCLTGAQAAQRMLDAAGIRGVQIQRVSGFLSDHYDPRAKVVRLSPDVHDGTSIASVSVACHEVGHAIQDATRYPALVVRSAAVPVATIGSNLGLLLIMVALMLGGAAAGGFGQIAALLGVGLFGATVLFQLVTLPVEFDASWRAKQMLPKMGIIHGPQEQAAVNNVLNAAAMTYVAATVVALMQLLYWAWRLGLFGGQRRD